MAGRGLVLDRRNNLRTLPRWLPDTIPAGLGSDGSKERG